MRPPRLIERTDIPIDEIDCMNRLRPVTDKAVASLKASIETMGLQSEIHVRRIKKTGRLRLMAGGHRIEVYRQLGHATIPAKVWDCTDDMALLFEIDDNLAHAELDTLELSVFLARRKEVYGRAFPQAKRGAIGNMARHGLLTDDLSVSSFAATAAAKMGVSERMVFRLVAAGSALGPDEIGRLRRAPRKVSLADLQVIAKVGNPVDRYDIVEALSEGAAKSAKEVMKRKSAPGAAVKDPIQDAFKRLRDAWQRAPKEAQRRFVRDYHAELHPILSEAWKERQAMAPADAARAELERRARLSGEG
ncbi:ParB N-terminal domain-containing protein [Sedimentitalea sp. JM2-8]|uniref:ParB N-terminal domain-containing protein n=1 Tax=Sedimentitalea xiamensis TaxID=3050037 RepID=A0ABT7FC79_9RHOB|nr:ParB N-terminal domain-containing protein [Sedimentitalea xiamensis]MDK3072726.1 ParB N-terminal domain-containing protein [Sedimentitalea xiamensis]